MNPRDKGSTSTVEDRSKALRMFKCSKCAIEVPYHYFGKQPKFAKQLIFLEDSFICYDPFAPEKRALCLGSKCAGCMHPVCVTCSIFYTKRLCGDCAELIEDSLPQELHESIRKLRPKA